MLQRRLMYAGPNFMCSCMQNLDQVSDVKGMAFAWCDAAVVAKPTSDGLAFDVLGDCTTTLDDMTYRLRTVRLLMPSAHRLWHDASPLEVQFVHEAACGARLVLAALFREDDPSREVCAAIRSLLLEEVSVRLIDLIPLSRCFFVHNVSDSVQQRPFREQHMVSTSEMVISSAQLADLYARLSP